jgi:16S rRNA processing protein RimM
VVTWVTVARLGRTHGLRGEIGIDLVSLTPSDLQAIGSFTWRGRRGESRELRLVGIRPGGGRMIAQFSGVEDRDQAMVLTNGELCVERERVPDAGPGQAYTYQLLGLRVVDVGGRELGVVKEVLRTGAHPVYVVQGEGEILIPAAAPILKSVDLAAGVITVDMPAGLDEL